MTTPIYGAVEWSAAQASPWVPHNAALRLYEAAIRGSVLDRDLTAPPGSCDDGASYLVAATATGLWAGHDGKLAVAVGTDAASGWLFATIATEGQFLYVEDEAVRIQYVGAAWVTANLTPAWGDISGAIADQTDLTAALAAAGGNTGDAQQLNGIVSGLGINYVSDLDFEMAAGSFYLDGALLTAAAQTISLDAADGSNPRIDVLYVDDTGTLGKITGSPAASPSQPSVDPTTQLYLTFVLVPAAATTLGDISNVDIYREGAEWTGTVSGAGFTLDSTNNPYAGTKCIEGTAVSAGDYVKLVAGAPLGFDGDGNLTLRIRSKANWNPKRWLTLQWFEGGVARGAQVSLKSGSFGFDSSQTASYQLVVISKALFQVPAGVSVDELRIADVGGSIGFYLDEIILQTTGDTTGGSGQASGISQADADARYARRSLNLSDLTDAGDARTNIDVYSKAEVDGLVGSGARSIRATTGTSETALASDFGNIVTSNNAGAVTLTIPPDLSIAVGKVLELHQLGAGAVTLVAGSGVTIQSHGGMLKTAGQYALTGLVYVAANTYRFTGDMVA